MAKANATRSSKGAFDVNDITSRLQPHYHTCLCCSDSSGNSQDRNISIFNGTVPNNATFVIYIQYIDLCSQTAKLELLCEEPRSLWKAWSDVALIRNWASEEVSSVFATSHAVSHAYTTSPSSTKPSTSRGRGRPEPSFLRSILHAQSKIAMSMNKELFAT